MQTKQTDLARLLVGTKVFLVPQFQRHYKWKLPQWAELWEDIVEQYHSDDVQSGRLSKDEGHFLGSVVLHPAPGPASTVSRYWVIDGQQRLTTLMVLIAALRDLRAKNDPGWRPESYTYQYLANEYNSEARHRFVPGAKDHADFASTVFENKPAGQQGEAYEWYYKKLEALSSSDGFSFRKIENAILLRLLLVEINTSPEDNINQIFNTINHSGMKLSAVDLIRNHTFMQFDSSVAEELHESIWKPMEDMLGEQMLGQYLWAQLVRQNAKATQKDLYGPFQLHLENYARSHRLALSEATRVELTRLYAEARCYLAILDPSANGSLPLSGEMRSVLTDLSDWKSSTYIPLALELVAGVQSGKLPEPQALTGLKSVLSFLVRRALAGVPTNNLNRQLSALPSVVSGQSDVGAAVVRELQGTGRYWPRDSEIRERGRTTAIYLTAQPAQVKFILRKINDSLRPTERVDAEFLTVEHLVPQELSEEWRQYLWRNDAVPEAVEARVHTLGNLALTGENSSLGRRLPEAKSEMLAASNLPINREYPLQLPWTSSAIDTRTAALIELALEIWPRPVPREALQENQVSASPNSSEGAPSSFSIELLVETMPADRYVSLSELAESTSATEHNVVHSLAELKWPILSLPDGPVVPGLRDMRQDELSRAERISVRELVEAAQSLGSTGLDR